MNRITNNVAIVMTTERLIANILRALAGLNSCFLELNNEKLLKFRR